MNLISTLETMVLARDEIRGVKRVAREAAEVQAAMKVAVASGHKVFVRSNGFYDATASEIVITDTFSPSEVVRAYISMCKGYAGLDQSAWLAPDWGPVYAVPPQDSQLTKVARGSFCNVDIVAAYFTVYHRTGLGTRYRSLRFDYNGVDLAYPEQWKADKNLRNALVGVLRNSDVQYFENGVSRMLKHYTPLSNPGLVNGILSVLKAIYAEIISIAPPLVWNIDGGHWYADDERLEKALAVLDSWGMQSKLTLWEGGIGGVGIYDGFHISRPIRFRSWAEERPMTLHNAMKLKRSYLSISG